MSTMMKPNALARCQAFLINGNGVIPALGQLRWFGMGSHVSDNDPEVLEKYKERQLKGETKSHFPEDAPGWEENLASDSEAIVKAEQSRSKSVQEMQEETVECLKNEADNLVTGSGAGDQSSSSGGG